MDANNSLSGLPGWALAVVIALAVIEVALLVVGLIVLVRTPPSRLTLPVWAWALLIVVVGTIGPIAFLVAGRRPAAASDTPRPAGSGHAGSAADLLYGPKPPADGGGRA